MKSWIIPNALTISILFILGTVAATAQNPTTTIQWPPHPYFSLDENGKPIASALEIEEITVNGDSIIVGKPFAAGADWLKNFKVRVRNISNKAIASAQMNFYLPQSKTDDHNSITVWLAYGNVPVENAKPIMPDEEFDLAVNRFVYRDLAEKIAARNDPALLSTLWFMITTARFVDGTIFSSACVKAKDPANTCPLLR